MAEKEKYIGEAKMREKPKKALKFLIGEKAIKTKHLDDACVTTPKIKDRAVTPEKLSDGIQSAIVLPPVNMLDQKYQGITDELYSMIQSLQVGGIALSQKLGNREDIGISQKSLTDMFIRIWNKIGEMTGECYMGFSMVVEPTAIAAEGSIRVHVTADSSGSISNFDYIKIYANEVLKAEGMAVETFDAEFDIDDTSIIKCVAVIAGRTFTRQEKVTKYTPFFIGSGQVYQDIMNEDCLKDLDGTLEGSYDVTIKHNGDHMFIIIPISHKDEFRRVDMNGLGLKVEIPMTSTTYDDFVVYKSLNTYKAGTYGIDIDINS